MSASDTRRLFFALWPDANVRSALLDYMASIDHGAHRPMSLDNLHVTLAFLGAVATDRVSALLTLAQQLRFNDCELCFDRLAIWQPAHVLVLTTSHVPATLQQFVLELQTHLQAAGVPVDTRPYRPHVTLARDVRQPARDEAITPLSWSARDFVLVESVASGQGVRYQVLETFSACNLSV